MFKKQGKHTREIISLYEKNSDHIENYWAYCELELYLSKWKTVDSNNNVHIICLTLEH